jgi:signal transduction histidine kinase
MIVRTLFLKIFLWFWLALILVVATVILVVEPPAERGGRSMGGFEALTEYQLRGLAALHAAGDTPAFERQRKGLEELMNFEVLIVDEQGVEVSGRSVPEESLASAKRRIEWVRRMQSQERSERGERGPDGERIGLGRGERGGRERGGGERGSGSSPEPGAGEREQTGRTGPRIFAASFSGSDGKKLIAFAEEERRWSPGGRGGPIPSATRILSDTDFLSINVLMRIAAILLVAGLVCWGMARYLTAPIRRLQAASRELESGDLSVKVSPDLAKRHDEIGELARDFDRMARRVSTVISTQRQLLRDVSHELRSPLARLHVAVELASEDASAHGHALDRVRREADRLEELIGQLLALARLESGAVEQERVDFSLSDMLRATAEDAQFEASAKGRSVQIDQCEGCTMHGVPTLIRSAIDNVIRNAVDFTPAGAAVQVSLAIEPDGMAKLCVRDHGPGVPNESLSRIFEPFFRAITPNAQPRNGTGLGLAITERAVRLHRGSIEAANAEGGGLLMTLTLPTKGAAEGR